MQKQPFISVVVPVFNEELTVGDVVQGIRNALDAMGLNYEVIVVDDGSSDNSVNVALSSQAKVLMLKKHMGKGYALRAGFSKARGNIIITIDSDGSHDPKDIPKILEPILKDEADLIIGSRFLNNRNVFINGLNKAGAKILNFTIRILTGHAISDSQSGYRAFKSLIVKAISLKSVGYEIESEMLIKAIKKGFRAQEVPIKFEQRTYGRSKLDPIKDGLKILIASFAAFLGD
ncbi:MAG: glycosyltransferase family 2 protein [Candidatus Bathyarchaeia archaeon]|nr:glycosyltransferase family 2 protein [Candidatus Bathyarchaeota archaeon]